MRVDRRSVPKEALLRRVSARGGAVGVKLVQPSYSDGSLAILCLKLLQPSTTTCYHPLVA